MRLKNHAIIFNKDINSTFLGTKREYKIRKKPTQSNEQIKEISKSQLPQSSPETRKKMVDMIASFAINMLGTMSNIYYPEKIDTNELSEKWVNKIDQVFSENTEQPDWTPGDNKIPAAVSEVLNEMEQDLHSIFNPDNKASLKNAIELSSAKTKEELANTTYIYHYLNASTRFLMEGC